MPIKIAAQQLAAAPPLGFSSGYPDTIKATRPGWGSSNKRFRSWLRTTKLIR